MTAPLPNPRKLPPRPKRRNRSPRKSLRFRIAAIAALAVGLLTLPMVPLGSALPDEVGQAVDSVIPDAVEIAVLTAIPDSVEDTLTVQKADAAWNPLGRCTHYLKSGYVYTRWGGYVKRWWQVQAAVCAGGLGYGIGKSITNNSWYKQRQKNRLDGCWPNCSSWDFTKAIFGW